jgi:hypothetical protein
MVIGIVLYCDDNQMTWIGADNMYRESLTYFERVNQLYRDYILNIQKVNDLLIKYKGSYMNSLIALTSPCCLTP